jgi:hypothetical protein
MGPSARPYDEVIDAWRTSCPRLTVWEDANDDGFLTVRSEPGAGRMVSVSPLGRAHLLARRPPAPSGVTVVAGGSGDAHH